MNGETLVRWPDPFDPAHLFEMDVDDLRHLIAVAERDLETATGEQRAWLIETAAYYGSILLGAELIEITSPGLSSDAPRVLEDPVESWVPVRDLVERAGMDIELGWEDKEL